jgi:hypothetical protein
VSAPAAVQPAGEKLPLDPGQRRAAIVAGAVAGGLFGVGWGILGAVTLLGLVVIAFGALLLMLFGGADITGGLGVVFIVVLLIAFAIGALLVVLSVVISRRILRTGGVHRPTAVTWMSLLIVLVVNTVAQRIADPALALTDSDAPAGPRTVAAVVLLLVAVGAGVGAWLLMAMAFRPRSGAALGVTASPAAAPAPGGPSVPPPAAEVGYTAAPPS